MVTEDDTADDLRTRQRADAGEVMPQVRKRRVKVRRRQEKFPRPVRLLLLLGLPMMLWVGIYFAGRALL